jgi:hypothetical protein
MFSMLSDDYLRGFAAALPARRRNPEGAYDSALPKTPPPAPIARFVPAGNGLFRREWLPTMALDEAPMATPAQQQQAEAIREANEAAEAELDDMQKEAAEKRCQVLITKIYDLVEKSNIEGDELSQLYSLIDDLAHIGANIGREPTDEPSDMPAQDARLRRVAPPPKGITMPTLAMDAGSVAVRALQEFRRAEQECAAVLGHAPGMAFDSAVSNASDVYKLALDRMGVNLHTATPAAYGDIFRAVKTARLNAGRQLFAPPSAADQASFAARYPEAARIKVLG